MIPETVPAFYASLPRFHDVGWYQNTPFSPRIAVSHYTLGRCDVFVPLTQFVIDCPHRFVPGEVYGRLA